MKHSRERRNRNRLLRGRAPNRGGGSLTLRQQIGQVLGVEPQVFADARDLTVGDGNDVATWGDFVSAAGASIGGGGTVVDPLFDADGWDGSLPTVSFGGTAALINTAQSAAYDGHPPHLWVFTGTRVSDAGNGNESFATVNKTGNNREYLQFRMLQFSESNMQFSYSTSDNDATETDDSILGRVVTGRFHIGVAFDGTVHHKVLVDTSGTSVIEEGTPIQQKSPDFSSSRIILGANWGTSVVHLLHGDLAAVSMAVCNPGQATLANLQAALILHNQAYPVA